MKTQYQYALILLSNFIVWFFVIFTISLLSGCCSTKCVVTKYVEKTDTLTVPEFIYDSLTQNYVIDLQKELQSAWAYMSDRDGRTKKLNNDISNLKKEIGVLTADNKKKDRQIKSLQGDLKRCNKKQRIAIRRNDAPVTINLNEASDSSKIETNISQDIKSNKEKKGISIFLWLFIVTLILLILTNLSKIKSIVK